MPKKRVNAKHGTRQCPFGAAYFTAILAPLALALMTLFFLLLQLKNGNRYTTQEFSEQSGQYKFVLREINMTQEYFSFGVSESAQNPTTEDPPKLASILYYIMATNGEGWKLVRLLKRIQAPRNIYMLHLDQKMNEVEKNELVSEIKNMNETVGNIYLMNSYVATYKGITLVDQEITAMAYGLSLNHKWTHFINLSPSAYPLMSQYQICSLLGQSPPELSFLQLEVADCATVLARFTHLYYDLGLWGYSSKGAMESKQRVPAPKGIKLFKAFQWKVLSRDLTSYFVFSQDGWARRMFAFFASTLIPDEHYFPTTACNSPVVNSTIRGASLHYMNWENIDWGARRGRIGPNPIDLNLLEEALQQGSFFARKFENDFASMQSMQLVDQLLDEGMIILNGITYTREGQYETSKKYLSKSIQYGEQCQELIIADKEQPCVSKRLVLRNQNG